MKTRLATLLAAFTVALSTAALGAGQFSASYKIPADVVNNGVGDMNSTSYKLSSSVGDAFFTAPLTSTNYKLNPGFRAEINSGTATIALVAVQSRKVHGATGTYDIPIDSTIALAGLVSVEPRTISSGHVIVFQFDGPITVAGTVTVVDALAAPIGTPSAVASGNDVQVNITGVPDNKRVTVTLTGVNGTLTTSASVGFLVGDTNNSRSVTATDILQVKGRSGQITDATNFKFDLNASGSITSADILAVKGRSGLVLP